MTGRAESAAKNEVSPKAEAGRNSISPVGW